MFENLKTIDHTMRELEGKLADPALLADHDAWMKVNREYNKVKPLAEAYGVYEKALAAAAEDRVLIDEAEDADMVAMLREDLEAQEELVAAQETEIKMLLVPKDPNDYKNVIVEIRAGAGGDEAGLFAGDLYRMYHMYAEKEHFSTEDLSMTEQGIGGVKEATFMVKGEGAYSKLKYESGVHRVQRVPATESQGRIHTSTATVAVLPEAEEVDVALDMNDVRVDVYRSSGHGGQSVNTTDSAVRVTHLPTGIVIAIQDEKSQLKNKEKALGLLRARLYELELEKQQQEMSSERHSQIGTGDRSERIRTYNFPQGRITDHRINRTIYRLQEFLDGDIGEMIEALQTEDQLKKLALLSEKEIV
ncbi:MAG: peptide chain release factor 1 [Peptoniphilaceae bacterium]|nr:peptide chain release factor 1 [Peptoniphilaceae bacterium]MDY6086346.1 peptide chain release factor 1 [Peptoniphilaceae bacterium]